MHPEVPDPFRFGGVKLISEKPLPTSKINAISKPIGIGLLRTVARRAWFTRTYTAMVGHPSTNSV